MPDHINIPFLAIALTIAFLFRFVLLMTGLLIMIKLEKYDFTWLPLIGAALLACALDMIPLVGHYIAVPVLYLCIWKITNSDLFPDAAFTAGLSYAFVRCVTLIVMAYIPFNAHPRTAQDIFSFETNAVVANSQFTNEIAQMNSPAEEAANNKINTDISVSSISRIANSAMVTIQSGRKTYSLSLGEGTTISTDKGTVRVHFLEADAHDVTLDVNGQKMKYALK